MIVRGLRQTRRSLGQHVLAILYSQLNALTVVETVAVLFGEVVDALAGGDVTLGEQGLTNRLAEFRRARLGLFQGHRNDALENQERIVGVPGELAAAVRTVFCLVSFVQSQARF